MSTAGLRTTTRRFPGPLQLVGEWLVGRIPLSVLGDPSKVRISVVTQRSDPESGDVTAEDLVPKGSQFEPSDTWLTVGG